MDQVCGCSFDGHERNGDRPHQRHGLSVPSGGCERRGNWHLRSVNRTHSPNGGGRSDRPCWHDRQRPSDTCMGGTNFQWGFCDHRLCGSAKQQQRHLVDYIRACGFDGHERNGDGPDQRHGLSVPSGGCERRGNWHLRSVNRAHSPNSGGRSDRPCWHCGQRPSDTGMGGTNFQWWFCDQRLPR